MFSRLFLQGAAAFLFLLSLTAVPALSKAPLKAVIVTGQNNHNWPVSSASIRSTLESSGLFDVQTAVSPAQGEDMASFNVAFREYDVVIVDYNGDSWNPSMRAAFEEYAGKGGGIIFYHAADNAFPEWEEYNRMTALGGWGGRDENSGPYVYYRDGVLVRDFSPGPGGSHGQQHEYEMLCRSSHPVVKGLPPVWTHAVDELYDRMRGPGNIGEVLYSAYSPSALCGSGREEPLVFTVDYGKARIMHIMIGHAGPSPEENPAMDCPGFKTLLVRSAQWCGRRKPTYVGSGFAR
ncbi:MAG: ThuA domain-containing protein [Candidatus Cryptobacteroides sp.]